MNSTLSARVVASGTSLQLEDGDGTLILRYEHLLAFDATGRQLPAHMETLGGTTLALVVEDQGAQYPIVVDPVIVGLVKDINLTTASSSPSLLTAVGSTLYFAANDGTTGLELWKSDGTEEGTVLVKDIVPGSGSSSPQYLTAVGSTLYFSAYDATTGYELWRSDGTESGTARVKDVRSGPASSELQNLTAVGSTLYFSANDGITGVELWKSDGTEAGTALVKDIFVGSSSSFAGNLTAVGSTLYFSADDGDRGRELWKSDGTEEVTVRVKDIYSGSGSSSPANLTAVGSTLYFSAVDASTFTATTGRELWKSDGTSAGTVRVKDIVAGGGSSSPVNLTAVGSTLYFRANDGTTGSELWKSDGTSAGTVRVKDIVAGSGSSTPVNLTAFGGTLFFSANDGATGSELWKSDGTSAGTVRVKDIFVGSSSSSPQNLTAVGSTLFFNANDGVTGSELWKSDGTSAGTVCVKDIVAGSGSSSLNNLTAVGSTLYFQANDGTTGNELWKSDGTEYGTVRVRDIQWQTQSSSPGIFVTIGNLLYFRASDGVSGFELWKSDGTEVGTAQVKDILVGSGSGSPDSLIAVGSTLYFTAADASSGRELWKSDGTELGTVRVKDVYFGSIGSSPHTLTAVGSTLYFAADDGSSGRELWKSDGTESGTIRVKDIVSGSGSSSPQFLTAVGSTLYFRADDGSTGYELWKSDGTPAGTVRVKDILVGSVSSSPDNLTAVGSMLYFSASDSTSGRELWKSDGTEAGTVIVKDVWAGFGSSSPQNLTAVGSTLYFAASDATSGVELWKSDGTDAGTVPVKDIRPGSLPGAPQNLTAVGGLLYFTAADGTAGSELWKSDGTEAGTIRVKDIFAGSGSGSPGNLTAVGSTLYFSASDGTTGHELWKSDGTESGTVLAADIWPGPNSSSPQQIKVLGSRLLFAASDGETGRELWYALDLSNLAPTALDLSPAFVAENEPVGTTVGLLSTTDPDAGDTHSYAFASGEGDTDNALFTLAGDTLLTAASFDHEAQSTRTVRIRSTDAGGEFVERAFLITVGDVNEAPVVANALPDSVTTTYGGGFYYAFAAGTFTDVDAGQTLSYSASGMPPGITFDPATRSFTGTGPAGEFLVTVTATDDGTPALSAQDSMLFIIHPAPLTVTAADASRAYGQANPAFTGTLAGVVNGDAITAGYTTTATPASPAGIYAITPTLNDPDGKLANYSVSSVNGTLTVTPRVLNVAANPQTKVYGDADPALTYAADALVAGDSFTGALVRVAGEGVGDYAITQGTLTAGGNYALNFTGADLAITPKAISVAANPQTKVYGDADPALSYAADALVAGDSFIGALVRTAGENVGDYAITQGTFSAGSNYALSFTGADLAITPKGIAVTANPQTKVYGDADPELTYAADALVAGDSFTGALMRTAGENVGDYAITQGTLTAGGNYALNFTGADLAITPKGIAVAANPQAKVYGDADPALTYNADALVAGDSFNGALVRTLGENVGNYAITQGTLSAGSNYTLNFTGADLAITPKGIAVAANPQTKVYGDADPSLSYTADALVAGDSFSGALIRAEGENVGDYAITQGTLAAGGNYTLSFTGADLAITPKTISVAANPQTKVYGDADPALTYTADALVAGDSFSGALVRAVGENVGGYAITQGTLTAGSNYAVSFTGADLAITPKTISVAANPQTKVYGDADPALTYAADALVAGDSFTGALVRAVGEGVGDYAITEGTLTAGSNYALNFTGADLAITVRALAVSGNDATRAYGEVNPVFTGTLTGVVNGDNITADYTSTATTLSPVGSYPTTPSLNDPDGKLLNYAVTANNGTLTVTPAHATVAANAKSKPYGEANPALDAIVTGAVPAGDPILYTLDTTATQLSGVGDYPITVTPGSNPNYSVTLTDATLTVNAALATVVANAKSKRYGEANPALDAEVTGGVPGGDAVEYTLATTATPLSGVGSYPITVTLGANPNYTVSTTESTLTLEAASLTVMADNQSRLFEQPNPEFTGTIQGIQNADDITATYSSLATAASAVGTYAIVPTLVDVGGKLGNYIVTVYNGTLTIVAAPLQVTIHGPESGLVRAVDVPVQFAGSFTTTGNPGAYLARWIVSNSSLPETELPGTVDGNTVTAEVEFSSPGVYQIRLEVVDGSGTQGVSDTVEEELPAFVVIYDPNGGFVTGGGWIWSPAGAFHPELAEYAGVSGKASFGFNAKYQKGANKPSGNTEFQFKAGNLHFKSSVYQWLVVAGAKAQYKGEGSINGESGFGFMLTGVDGALIGGGKPDRFRMKIWSSATGIVVYDNQAFTGDDAELGDATILGGGQVVIHKSK